MRRATRRVSRRGLLAGTSDVLAYADCGRVTLEAPSWARAAQLTLLLSEQSFFVVVGGVASVILSAVTDNRGFYFYLIPAALGLAATYWGSFNKGYNFTAAISPDGIRLRYGLLDTQAQTLPPLPVSHGRREASPWPVAFCSTGR